MAFLDGRSKERFSLLLLEPGEIYFEDFSVFYYPGGLPEQNAIRKCQKGRLKLCSKSVVFDPEDCNRPILKFPLRNCEAIEKWDGSLLSKIGNKGGCIHIRCEQVVEMVEGNLIAPYTFRKGTDSYLFNLTYVNVDTCLPQMSQLRRAATLPAAEQSSMIAAIVMSRQSRVAFNTSWLEDLYEVIALETVGNRITPLVTNPGRIMLTSSRLYFQPFNNAEPWPVLKLRLADIKRVIKRRFLLRHVGLELYCSENAPLKHLFLSFKSYSERDTLYDKLLEQKALRLEDTGQENMMLLWQNGVIANYDYLLYLNSLADRSYNDLTQYPVFPWVISDYKSTEIDLSDESCYRDLRKPIGALNEDRLEKLKERYHEMQENKFLYGSHYSTPGFVLYYLVRKMPQYMLCLQNGRFDHPDRMFNSIPDTWRNVTSNTSDFKELIPEFYELEGTGDFLLNFQHLNFGLRHNGSKVGDVELPPWAKDPRDCVRKLRDALESPYVSSRIHHWIDLIFGHKQQGPEAANANNVFYYLTYEGAIDLDNIKDLNERYSLEVQIMEFGQIPKQIFYHPHPSRHLPNMDLEVQFRSEGQTDQEEELVASGNNGETKNGTKKRTSTVNSPWSLMDGRMSLLAEHKLHKDEITHVCLSPDLKTIYSVSQDSLLKVFSLEDKKQVRSVNVSNMALSSCFLMKDGKTIIVASWDNYVYVYNIEYGRVCGATMAHDDAVIDICWNNGIMATASWDSTAKVWNFSGNIVSSRAHASADLLAELEHDTGVRCVALNPDNSVLATGTNDGHINMWSLSNYAVERQLSVHQDTVEDLAFSPDGYKVISCSKDQTVKVLDAATGAILFSKHAGEELRCVSWDGVTALTGGEQGHVITWNLLTAQQVACSSAHKGPVISIDVSPDGQLVVTGGTDRRVCVWKTERPL